MVDVLIIGGGLAGLLTALQIPPSKRVVLVTKKTSKNSNSYLAQGGIAAAVGPGDTPEKHYEDTMVCGHYANDPKAVQVLVTEGPAAVNYLSSIGVHFDRKGKEFALGMEGAHASPRILRIGDYTGSAIMDVVMERVREKNNIKIYENTQLTKLLVSDGLCYGAVLARESGPLSVTSHAVVMATGGIGQKFDRTTNDETIDGSGIEIAASHGVDLRQMDKVQFHPTALYEPDTCNKAFLISEAVRGEGAFLVDGQGNRFMHGIHKDLELAPRDVVSSAIFEVMARQKTSHVFLDVRHFPQGFFKKRFPTIDTYCRSKGIEPETGLIPVAPCAHYLMGGIAVDLHGRTNMEGLFAVGECAHTGVHGDNRLASNSLLEVIVFSKRVADAVERKGGQSNDRC